MPKRNDYLSWDDFFMGVSLITAKRSKDPNTQVGACIVNDKNHIISVGYNGLPVGCDDDLFPWENQGDFLDTKYPYVCHAELNAILNHPGMSLENARIYVSLFPCHECCKAIIQSGIKQIIYLEDKYAKTPSLIASKKMLQHSGVSFRLLEPSIKELNISFISKEHK